MVLSAIRVYVVAPLCVSLFSVAGHAYFSTLDTAETVPVGRNRFILEGQLAIQPRLLGHNSLRYDTGLSERSSFRAVLGTGPLMPAEWGLFHKWNPIPDAESRPGFALMSGLLLGRHGDTGVFNLRVHPILSKKFSVQVGELVPYAALPFGTTWTNGTASYPLQLTVGANLTPSRWKGLGILAEGGVNVLDSFSYVSLGLSWVN